MRIGVGGVLVITMVLTGTLLGCPTMKRYVKDVVQETATVEANSTVRIVDMMGTVTVKTVPQTDRVTIIATKRAECDWDAELSAPLRDWLEPLDILIVRVDSALEIRALFPAQENMEAVTQSIDLDIEIPSSVALDIAVGEGDVDADADHDIVCAVGTGVARVTCDGAMATVNVSQGTGVLLGGFDSGTMAIGDGTAHVYEPQTESQAIDCFVAQGAIQYVATGGSAMAYTLEIEVTEGGITSDELVLPITEVGTGASCSYDFYGGGETVSLQVGTGAVCVDVWYAPPN